MSLIAIAVLIAVILCSVYWLDKTLYSRYSESEAQTKLQAFNIAALSRLLSQDERDFLLSRLNRSSFARIQRKRMRVALLYLSELSAILNALGAKNAPELKYLVANARLIAIWAWLFPDTALPKFELQQRLHRLKVVVQSSES